MTNTFQSKTLYNNCYVTYHSLFHVNYAQLTRVVNLHKWEFVQFLTNRKCGLLNMLYYWNGFYYILSFVWVCNSCLSTGDIVKIVQTALYCDTFLWGATSMYIQTNIVPIQSLIMLSNIHRQQMFREGTYFMYVYIHLLN